MNGLKIDECRTDEQINKILRPTKRLDNLNTQNGLKATVENCVSSLDGQMKSKSGLTKANSSHPG